MSFESTEAMNGDDVEGRATASSQSSGNSIHPRFIERVVIRNYKSIAGCDVSLSNLTFLVGPNGSGKSNFLDAIRFITDSLRNSLDHALRDRGGVKEVRRRSSGHPTHFGIRLDFRLPDRAYGHYSFDVASKIQGTYSVQHEECTIRHGITGTIIGRYSVEEGRVTSSSVTSPPAASRDRLYLVNVSGLHEFRPIYDALSNMGFYNLNPDVIRELQSPDPGLILSRDGSNIASVLKTLTTRNPQVKERIEEYLSKIVSSISGVDAIPVGPKETLQFRQDVSGAKYPWRFIAANMSDGTLRALGNLVALFQSGSDSIVPFVGIEEPETALHPAAAGILTDGLADASEHTQVAVTSHSPDLLDNEKIPDESLLAVISERGETKIGPLDPAGRSALRDHLFTAGDLLRMDQLRPDPRAINLRPEQLPLFGED
ncbi:MAG TPA: AAA family ATPase [Longimicrobium sp.]